VTYHALYEVGDDFDNHYLAATDEVARAAFTYCRRRSNQPFIELEKIEWRGAIVYWLYRRHLNRFNFTFNGKRVVITEHRGNRVLTMEVRADCEQTVIEAHLMGLFDSG
jgi:hypothetical protein